METNESILKRQVVAFDERKKVGAVKGMYVDMDARTVKAFVVADAETGSAFVLPFEKTLSIGSAFITIKEGSYLLAANTTEAKKAREGEYQLVGLEAYSRAGNLLGTVKHYEFDPVHGTVTKAYVDNKKFFTAEQFLFFSPELIMVDDGTPTAEDYRKGKKPRKKVARKTTTRRAPASKAKAKKPADQAAKPSTAKPGVATSTSAAKPKAVESKKVEAQKATPSAKTTPETKPASTVPVQKKNDENASLREFLTGAKIVEDVASPNGKFKVAAGTTLTEAMVADAENNDALVLLTLSVEE